jgi:hypothetical protein
MMGAMKRIERCLGQWHPGIFWYCTWHLKGAGDGHLAHNNHFLILKNIFYILKDLITTNLI